ncbi:MAG: amino acid deaminase, partial [Pseudomonadota bacterium]
MPSLTDINHSSISHLEKGMPPVDGVNPANIASRGWNVLAQDMSFPIALLREKAIEHNARWMERFALDQQVWLYPHGKTTMAPQIFDIQLRNGCQGITAANVTHAQVYLEHGVESVFIANQVVGIQALRRFAKLCRDYPSVDFFLIVDSEANALELKAELGDFLVSGQIKLLLEVGAPGGRTGVRTLDEAMRLAAFTAEQGIPVHGLEAFEG